MYKMKKRTKEGGVKVRKWEGEKVK